MNDVLRPDVAIVGGGPAGIGAALELRARGVPHVMVFEREPEAGGIPRHCAHPPFGIREFRRILTGPEYARRLRADAIRAGVDVRTRHSVIALDPGGALRIVSPERSLTVQARRVILAMGARETPRSARLISGERPIGILNTGALQGCIQLNRMRPFSRPVIVGTELVSLSAVWSCMRHGIRPAAIVEAATTPTARWPLGLFPWLLRIPIHLGSRITDIAGSQRVERVEVTTDAGRRIDIGCDGVLFTGQFVPESALVRASALRLDGASGGPSIDQFGRCSDPVYFAAGNALRSIETAGWCHREGRSVGACVARDLRHPLPAGQPALRVVCGAGVKLVVPQSLAASDVAAALTRLQVRVTATVRGRLTVRCEDRILWSANGTFRRERRLTIPLQQFAVAAAADSVTVAIEPTGS
jgi:NADPH-dependent 2,4-dienoyl-CoA reductase/sulfur reductase-like enzyme